MVSTEIRKQMNREFRVKVNCGSMSKLVGWEGLVSLVGRFNAFLLVSEALECPWDKWARKMRNGVKVTFYVK